MRREELYLRDIVEAADHIAKFLIGYDFSKFQDDELVQSAVVQKLAVIGEAAGRISEELKDRHPDVPWPRMVAFRNILIHAYFGIDWTVVWQAASHQAPELRREIISILDAEFGQNQGPVS